MSSPKKLVLDANILVRAVFGKKVYGLLKHYEDLAEFYAPDQCVEEAHRNLPLIAAHRRVDSAQADAVLGKIVENFINLVDRSLYEDFEERDRARIAARDVDDCLSLQPLC
jgi:predicted nucleic acid-binding protein